MDSAQVIAGRLVIGIAGNGLTQSGDGPFLVPCIEQSGLEHQINSVASDFPVPEELTERFQRDALSTGAEAVGPKQGPKVIEPDSVVPNGGPGPRRDEKS
jgi:hypothetical protein